MTRRPDGLVAYLVIAKCAERLGDVEAALAPYIARNRFAWPLRWRS